MRVGLKVKGTPGTVTTPGTPGTPGKVRGERVIGDW
jgi:hypothetical protein